MNRRLITLAIATLAAVAMVLLVLADRPQVPAPPHGKFTDRFQPKTASASTEQRVAGLGSITELRPLAPTSGDTRP